MLKDSNLGRNTRADEAKSDRAKGSRLHLGLRSHVLAEAALNQWNRDDE